jgi:tetratricopeptide (TPR) repeat protein
MPRPRQHWLCAAVLAGVTFAVFSPALGGEFVNFDDFTYVSRNPSVLGGLSGQGLRWALTTYRAANWHPLTWLSLQLDASLGGASQGRVDARVFHGTNVLLHALNAALLFLALRALTGAYWRSAAAALLFAVHPLRVESVAWVSERKDVLSVCFGLLALWAYGGYARAPSQPRYLAVFAALGLSLLSKPTLVTLPCLLLVLDWWPLARVRGPRDWRRLAAEKLPLFALAAAACVVTYVAQADQGAVADAEEFPPPARAANAAVSYVAYLGNTFWPTRLAAYYPHPGAGLRPPETAAAAALLAGLTAAAVVMRRRSPYVLAGWLWYLGTLVPALGLVQVGLQARADRYTYFPQIGILVSVCWGVPELARGRPRAAAALAAAVAVAFAGLTVKQIGYWHDSLTLWQHAVDAAGESATAMANIGETLEQAGEPDRAAAFYRRAIALGPKNVQGYVNLGCLLQNQGKLPEAAAVFGEIIGVAPDSPVGYTNLGVLRVKERKLDEAAGLLEKAYRLAPGDKERVLNYAIVEEEKKNYPRAAELYAEALRLQPDDANGHIGLGVVLLRQGGGQEGLAHLREACRLDPDSERAHTLLGKALAARQDARGAAWHFEQVTRLRPDQPSAWYNLGVALGQQGNAARAADCFARAAELDPHSAPAWKALRGTLGQLRRAGQHELADRIERRVGGLTPAAGGPAP